MPEEVSQHNDRSIMVDLQKFNKDLDDRLKEQTAAISKSMSDQFEIQLSKYKLQEQEHRHALKERVSKVEELSSRCDDKAKKLFEMVDEHGRAIAELTNTFNQSLVEVKSYFNQSMAEFRNDLAERRGMEKQTNRNTVLISSACAIICAGSALITFLVK